MHSTSFPNKYKLFQACRIAFTDSIWYRVVLSRDLPGGEDVFSCIFCVATDCLWVWTWTNNLEAHSEELFANNMFSSGYSLNWITLPALPSLLPLICHSWDLVYDEVNLHIPRNRIGGLMDASLDCCYAKKSNGTTEAVFGNIVEMWVN